MIRCFRARELATGCTLCCLWLLLAILGACAEAPRQGTVLHERLIEENPEGILRAQSLQAAEVLRKWSLDSSATPPASDELSFEGFEQTAEGLKVVGEEARVKLILAQPLDSGLLEIFGEGLAGAVFFMEWTDEHGEVTVARGIARDRFKVSLVNPSGRENRVSQVELWLSAVNLSLQGARLQAVDFLRLGAAPGRSRRAAKKVWRLDHRGQLHEGWWLSSFDTKRVSVTLPERSELRFDVAEIVANRLPATLTVGLRLPAQAEEEASQTIFEETYGQAAFGAEQELLPGWARRKVDLSTWAGKEVELTFAVSGSSETKTQKGLNLGLAIGNPEVVVPGPLDQPNVFLFSLDTLRADRLDLYGGPNETSSKLTTWSRKAAVVFENVTAAAPWTLPSHLSMFSGLDALDHGINAKDPFAFDPPLIAERFQAEGYRTIAVVAGAFLSPQYGFARGFDRYIVRDPVAEGELEQGLQELRALLERESDRPLFVFFHTYEAHSPYFVREPYFSRFGGQVDALPDELLVSVGDPSPSGGMTEYVIAPSRTTIAKASELPKLTEAAVQQLPTLYDSSVAFMDELVGGFLLELESRPWGERAAVIVTSDHGEGLGEMGRYAHGRLSEDNLAVPLLLRLPDRQFAGSRVSEPAQVIDVTPTLLAAAGLAPGPQSARGGEDLGARLRGAPRVKRESWSYAARARRGIALKLDNGMKYYFRNGAAAQSHGQEELYDLLSDPLETSDLAGQRETAKLRQRVQKRLLDRTSEITIELENRSDRTLRVRFSGQALLDAHFTASELARGCFERTPDEAWLTALPGVSCRLTLETLDSRLGPVKVDVGVQAGDSDFRLEQSSDVDFSLANAALFWTLGAQGWEEARPDESPGSAQEALAGFEISWNRTVSRIPDDAVPENDPELLKQLEALGYL